MSDKSNANPKWKATIAARVPRELKEAMVALADAGNRSTSREIAAAIAEHVDRQAPSTPPQPAAATSSAAGSEER